MTEAINSTKPEVPAALQTIQDKPFIVLDRWQIDDDKRYATKKEARDAIIIDIEEGNTRVQYIAKIISRVKVEAPTVKVIDEEITN